MLSPQKTNFKCLNTESAQWLVDWSFCTADFEWLQVFLSGRWRRSSLFECHCFEAPNPDILWRTPGIQSTQKGPPFRQPIFGAWIGIILPPFVRPLNYWYLQIVGLCQPNRENATMCRLVHKLQRPLAFCVCEKHLVEKHRSKVLFNPEIPMLQMRLCPSHEALGIQTSAHLIPGLETFVHNVRLRTMKTCGDRTATLQDGKESAGS